MPRSVNRPVVELVLNVGNGLIPVVFVLEFLEEYLPLPLLLPFKGEGSLTLRGLEETECYRGGFRPLR